ncbi:MAG: DUF5652 family protein [Patescibacteria group bacterium]
MFGFNVAGFNLWIILLILWTLPWKGYALWLSARNNQPRWFIALLLLNTVAILEIIYIFAIGRKVTKNPNIQANKGKVTEYSKHETVRVYSDSEK